MPEFSGPHDEVYADLVSRATLLRKAERDGAPYPIPPGEPVGDIAIADESIAYATHDVLPRQGNGGQWWVRVLPDSATLPPGLVRLQGRDVEPARMGVDRPESSFPDPFELREHGPGLGPPTDPGPPQQPPGQGQQSLTRGR